MKTQGPPPWAAQDRAVVPTFWFLPASRMPVSWRHGSLWQLSLVAEVA